MGEVIQFNQLNTSLKSMQSISSDERYFEGLLTVQMKDKQGEITIVDELYKVLPIWMDRGAPISDTHSNRIIGKGINYSKTTVKNEHGEELPAIKITGKIYKNYELDNVIWDKIKSKEYRGLSFGGATRSNRTPIKMKDGSMAYALSNLEHYEVAVCKDPAVPMAVITDYNPIAKATFNSELRDDGKMVIRCTNMGCFVEKSDVEHGMYGNVNTDTPFDATEDYEEDKREGDREQQQTEKADLNESQTFQQKVDALIREGKSEESAKKIVGSFVHKDKLPTAPKNDIRRLSGAFDEHHNLSDDEVDKSGYQTEAGNDKLGGQGATEDDPKKRKEEDEEKEDDELKRRDHSDSDGDMTSTYNQNVGREASSGRKLKAEGDYCPNCGKHKKREMGDMVTMGGACPSCGHGFKPKIGKADTTANQVGGVRENSAGTYIQGAGEANHINDVRNIVDKPERNEEKGAPNIKIAALTDTLKVISYSLVKHSQTQELKKLNNIIKPMTYSNSKFAMTYPKVGEKVWDSKQQKLVVENKKPKKGNSALNDKNASIQALKKINDDLGDARGCTEHKHQ